MRVGDQVLVQRDETRYPPSGSWDRFRGRTGTIVSVNTAGKHRRPEYGVDFSGSGRADAWFLPHELQRTAVWAP
ncbi:hypothetical protein JOF36_000765 [Pseudonocardia parietis]|uniref:Uncharacterized protein n=1 Tax=Pseudonocardia parietis TaxID=570936 RepID=A0ABS4VMB5_9PSEU|nr:hypothetical protein [Pseudonocardia parietis]